MHLENCTPCWHAFVCVLSSRRAGALSRHGVQNTLIDRGPYHRVLSVHRGTVLFSHVPRKSRSSSLLRNTVPSSDMGLFGGSSSGSASAVSSPQLEAATAEVGRHGN